MADPAVHTGRRVTWIGFYVNAVLMFFKIAAGYWGHSSVLIADGLHSFSDFATDIIAIVFIGIAHRKADDDHPYGHGKYETLASLIIAAMLLAVAAGIGFGAVTSAIDVVRGATLPRPAAITLVAALLSIAAKEWLFRYTIAAGHRISSSILITNAWHHRSDALSSVATVTGILAVMLLGGHWAIIEPLTAAIIAIFIAISSVRIAMPCINQLLERSLPDESVQTIERIITGTPGVKAYHRLRTRSNGNTCIIDVHIKVDPDITVSAAHAIATAAETAIRRQFGPSTIVNTHIEPFHYS